MKKYLFIVLVCLCGNVFGQTKTKKQPRRFEIEKFEILPDKKIVNGQQMTGGTDVMADGSEIHWDGHEYVPIKEIDFDNTSLIIAGNIVTFKEYFPIKTENISSLRVIHYTLDYSNNYTTLLSPLEDRVYVMYDGRLIGTVNIKGYKHVTGLIFKNEGGKLFFIPYEGSSLKDIHIPVDEASLRHVVYNYYADKNGLYFFCPDKGAKELESEKFNPVPSKVTLYENYFIYGSAAYPYGKTNITDDIRLYAFQSKLIRTPYGSYLGDGKKLFKLTFSDRDNIQSSITPQDFIQTGTPSEPVNEWNSFDIIAVGGNRKGDTLYYSSKQIYAGGGSYYSLIKTPLHFYGLTGSSSELKAVIFDKVMIYNADTQRYEEIDVDQFRQVTTNFYIYKNRMYYTNSHPFETSIDIHKLSPLTHYGKATEFYSDGKYLFGGYNLGHKETYEKSGQTWYKFKNTPFEDVDWESLQIVNRKILVDKNNIYKEEGSLMQIIPIKDLGLDVKVIKILK